MTEQPPQNLNNSDDGFVAKYGPYVAGIIAAGVIIRTQRPNYAGDSGYVIPAKPLTTSPSYKREIIDSWVTGHVQFARDDAEILQNKARIRKLCADYIGQLPIWQQAILLESPKPLIFGKSKEHIRELERQYGTSAKNVGGGFNPEDNSIRILNLVFRESSDIQVPLLHEEAHRIDYNITRSWLDSLLHSESRSLAWSDRNPRWKKAIEDELFSTRDPQLSLKRENPALASIRNHLSHPEYKPHVYPTEALAQMTATFNIVYANRQGNFATTNKFMRETYPSLWPVYRDEFIPELKAIANRLNPHIDLSQVISSAQVHGERGYSDRLGYGWQQYTSSDPSLGASFRYNHPFKTREEVREFCGAMSRSGVQAIPANSSGIWYAYVPQQDVASVVALRKQLSSPSPSPHSGNAPEPSWLDRAKAWLGPKAATPSAHEASVHGRGIVAGAAMTVTAGGITLLTTSSPAEAAIAAGEQAVSAVPGASGLFANNADERAIRNKVDALGLAGAGAGAWAGGVAGTPLPVAGNAAGALLGGAAGNLLLSMGSDELLRLSARYLEGKKSTVQPSAGEQAVAALIHAGAITIDQVKKWIIEAHAHSEKHPPRVSEIDSKHASANLTLAQAKAQQIQRPQGISAASSPEAHNSMVASTPATSSPLRLG